MVRNPTYSAMLLLVTGMMLLAPCAWTVMGVLVYVLLVLLQTRAEERRLLALHGDGYLD